MKRMLVLCGLLFVPVFSLLGQKPELAWVLNVNGSVNELQLETVHSKVRFTAEFDPEKAEFWNDRKYSLVEVAFDCTKSNNGQCDYVLPYTFRVAGEVAQLQRWYFLKSFEDASIAEPFHDNQLIVRTKNGQKEIVFRLRVDDEKSGEKLTILKKGEAVTFKLYDDDPITATVADVRMEITAVEFSK